jgi:hypothetical protein
LSVNRNSPLCKRGAGGISATCLSQILLFPPFSKGDLSEETYLRISSEN